MAKRVSISFDPNSIELPSIDLNTKEIIDYYAEETQNITKKKLKYIGETAQKLLTQLKAFEAWLNIQKKYWAKVLTSSEKNKINIELHKQKNYIQYEQLLKNAYIFIQKTRNILTGESLEYLLLFDESLTKAQDGQVQPDSKIIQLTLEQLLPAISLSLTDTQGNVGLRIDRTEELQRIYKEEETLEQKDKELNEQILNNFKNILKVRFQAIRDVKLKIATEELTEEMIKELTKGLYTSRGFTWEAAVKLVSDSAKKFNKTIENIYAQDTEAFWRGGDLKSALGEIHPLFQRKENLNLELKRVSATAQNSVQAGLVSLNGLITALTVIENVCLKKGLSKEEIKKYLKGILFNATKNITRDVAESIVNATEKELQKMLKHFQS